MWPRKTLEALAVALFELVGAGLGELSGDAPDLDDRHARRVGERDGHLQDDLQLVANGVGRTLVEGLGAVTGLQQKRLAVRHLASWSWRRRASPAKTSGGFVGEFCFDAREVRGVGPARALGGVVRCATSAASIRARTFPSINGRGCSAARQLRTLVGLPA